MSREDIALRATQQPLFYSNHLRTLSKLRSASGATTGHSSSACDEPETVRKRLENAFGGLGPRYIEERLEFRLGCCLDVELGSFLN